MIVIHKKSIRNNAISMKGCWHSEETMIKDQKILFKKTSTKNCKKNEQMKKQILQGKSSIPPINQ